MEEQNLGEAAPVQRFVIWSLSRWLKELNLTQNRSVRK
jgi:hypothetical protein